MAEEELDFRATKDIDMIILLEDRYQEFAEVFWAFIKEGGYRCGWKRSDKAHFYRFTEPRKRLSSTDRVVFKKARLSS